MSSMTLSIILLVALSLIGSSYALKCDRCHREEKCHVKECPEPGEFGPFLCASFGKRENKKGKGCILKRIMDKVFKEEDECRVLNGLAVLWLLQVEGRFGANYTMEEGKEELESLLENLEHLTSHSHEKEGKKESASAKSPANSGAASPKEDANSSEETGDGVSNSKENANSSTQTSAKAKEEIANSSMDLDGGGGKSKRDANSSSSVESGASSKEDANSKTNSSPPTTEKPKDANSNENEDSSGGAPNANYSIIPSGGFAKQKEDALSTLLWEFVQQLHIHELEELKEKISKLEGMTEEQWLQIVEDELASLESLEMDEHDDSPGQSLERQLKGQGEEGQGQGRQGHEHSEEGHEDHKGRNTHIHVQIHLRREGKYPACSCNQDSCNNNDWIDNEAEKKAKKSMAPSLLKSGNYAIVILMTVAGLGLVVVGLGF